MQTGEMPSWNTIVAEGNPAQSADNLDLKAYTVNWTEQPLNESTVGYTGSTTQISDATFEYGFSGGQTTTAESRGSITATSANIKSLTLQSLTYTSMTVGGFPIYLEGENILIGSGVTVEAGKTLDLYNAEGQTGTLTISTNLISGEIPALKADHIAMHNVKALTLFANGSALKSSDGSDNCTSVTYYDGDTVMPYGQGWRQDNGASSATAVTEESLALSNTGKYVKFYVATTDAKATPAALSYDKGTGAGTISTVLTAPAVNGKIHGFMPNGEAGIVELIDGNTKTRLELTKDYDWNVETHELSLLKSLLNGLERGSYTLRVYFYDDNPADATTYSLDIPLTITHAQVASGDLTLTPSGNDLKLGRGKTMTFRATPTGTTPAAYVWTVNEEEVQADATGSAYTLTVSESETLGRQLLVTVTSYADTAKLIQLGTASATVTVTPSATDIAISCKGETPSGDGNYILYHNTGSGTAKTWDFDAVVSLDNRDTSDKEVTWGLWGAVMRTTQVDPKTGVLTIAPNETGTGGILKLTAYYTNADRSITSKEVTIRLSTDAFVSYVAGASAKGQIVGAVYGVSQTAVAAGGQWIPANNQVVVTAAPAEGCAVKTWYVNGVSVRDDAAYTVDAECHTLTFTTESMKQYAITADFTNEDSYTVTYSAGANGSLSATSGGTALLSGGTVVKGEDVVFTAKPAADFRVDHWTVDGKVYKTASGETYTEETLTLTALDADRTVTVTFVGKEITIAFLAAPTGGAAPKGSLTLLVNGQKVAVEPKKNTDNSLSYTATVHAMDDVVILASPASGHLVDRWSAKDGSGYQDIADSSGKVTYAVEDIRSGFDVKVGFVAIPKRTVTVNANSYENGTGVVKNGAVTVPMSGQERFEVTQHDTLTLLAVPDTGCYLYQWRVSDGAEYTQDGNVLTLLDVTGDVTVDADFRRDVYEVTLETEGNGSLTGHYELAIEESYTGALAEGTTEVKGDAKIDFTISPNSGWILSSLTVNGETVTAQWDENAQAYHYTIPSLTENVTVKATFTEAPLRHDVTAPESFADEGGTTSGTVAITHVPDGISGDADNGDSTVEIAQGGAAVMTFCAEDGYIVDGMKLQNAVGTVLEEKNSRADCNISLSLEGYAVQISNVDQPLDFSEMESPFVKMEASMFNVGYSATGNGTLQVLAGDIQVLPGAQLPEGTELTIRAVPNEHCKVTSLTNGGTDLDSEKSGGTWTADLTVDSNVDLTAAFAVAEHKVTVNVLGTGGGTVTINDTDYWSGTYYLEAGALLDIQAEANGNSTLSQKIISGGAPVSGVDEDGGIKYLLNSDMQITVAFEAKTCVVTYNDPTNGTLTVLDGSGEKVVSDQSVPVGTTLIVLTVPDAHYQLDTLTAGGTPVTGNSYLVNAAKNNEIVCRFAVAEVPVTWTAEHGTVRVALPDGTLVSNGQYVAVGSDLRITATPSTDYSLKSLDVPDAVQNGDRYTVGSQPVAIKATFEYTGNTPAGPVGPVGPVGPSGGGGGGGLVSDSEYAVVIASAGNGKVRVVANGKEIASGDMVKLGTKLTITAEPSGGDALRELKVNGVAFASGGTYEVYANTEITAVFGEAGKGYPYYLDENGNRVFLGFSYDRNGDGTWTADEYIAPAGKSILFAENHRTFQDVTGHWAKPYIDFVTDREIFVGVADTLFDPDGDVTRAMFVTVVGRLYERSYGPLTTDGTHAFDDCDYAAYYGKYVDWAAKNGVVEGYGDRKFGPNDKITREQMATMLQRFAVLLDVMPKDVDTVLEYTDRDSIAAWARSGALYCQTEGLIQGVGEGRFAPQELATRAQMATIMHNFIKVVLR